jgi:DNA polymerase-3 subunit gamma/tau
MSYQVLARKWRPQFFKDMVGQEHVMRALINALDNQRLHHAYLFTGTRGVGKTTIARILAKCLNCEKGISSEPCGTCSSCIEISEGRFVDLIEVDAASRTKVEDTREILDNVQYAPTRGRFKVYLIDEVHMLSNSSFNALLKTLEEPPSHVKFLLATTDPQKLPATILSRCLQFSLKNMTPERIVGYLQHILALEKIPAEDPGLWLLGRAAEGSMRDALSLTDQAISFGDGEIKELEVATMLGTVDRGRVFQLAIALAEANAADVMALIAQMAEHAVDFNNLLADLIGLIHRIAIAQAVPDAVDNSQGDKEQVMALAQAMSPSMVQLLYQVALTGKRDLPIAPDPRAGMEMTMLRMLNFAPIGRQAEAGSPPSGIGAPPAKKPDLAHLKRQIVNSVAQGSQGNADAPEIENPIVQPAVIEPAVIEPDVIEPAVIEPVAEVSANQPVVAVQADEPPFDMDMPSYQPGSSTDQAPEAEKQSQPVEPEPVVQAPVVQAAITPEPVAAEPAPVSPEPQVVEPIVQSEDVEPVVEKQEIMDLSPASWALVFDHLPVEGMLRNLVANSCLIQMDGNQLLFHGDSGHMRLFSASHQQRFNEILNEALGKQYTLQVIDGPLLHETPAQRAQRLMAEKQKAAVESIENDPNVMAIRQAFDAMVIMESITPLH